MRQSHFEHFAPICPACSRLGDRNGHRLDSVLRYAADGLDILQGVLHCAGESCRQEYPIIDGIPIIVPDVRRVLADHAIELMLRDDLDPVLESLVGDAVGPDSWLDACRQTLSTYGWDSYASLDPEERAGPMMPGAALRCLARLLGLAPMPTLAPRHVLDIGCGAGRTTFALAEHHRDALVLGIDLHLGLLRLARRAASGRVRYPRRRIGIVYDVRDYEAEIPGAVRTDFWACDALALPFAGGSTELALCLNVLDAVGDPPGLLRELARTLRSGGRLLLGTPFDWATRATPVEAWLGGHSQRTRDKGDPVSRLHWLLDAAGGFSRLAEDADWPWQTRLHDRASVQYRTYLLALERNAP
jgi:SAM-dependent methyltransferase/uncharacterized protein YbaR (Trm112 family)